MAAPDTTHSIVIRDHPYEPRRDDEPWGLCKCGLSQACHERTTGPYISTSPPAVSPPLPPGARLVELGQGDGDDEPHPLPVPEIGIEEYEELKAPEDVMVCWKCGTKDGVHKLPENGAILCIPCREILKP